METRLKPQGRSRVYLRDQRSNRLLLASLEHTRVAPLALQWAKARHKRNTLDGNEAVKLVVSGMRSFSRKATPVAASLAERALRARPRVSLVSTRARTSAHTLHTRRKV